MSKIQIKDSHRKMVVDILKVYPFRAFVFGSRAKNAAKEFSDLDLCIKEPISKDTLRELQRKLEDSNLPYKVDVILWSEISSEFRAQIEKDLIEFV